MVLGIPDAHIGNVDRIITVVRVIIIAVAISIMVGIVIIVEFIIPVSPAGIIDRHPDGTVIINLRLFFFCSYHIIFFNGPCRRIIHIIGGLTTAVSGAAAADQRCKYYYE
jgi:hypothetical protein